MATRLGRVVGRIANAILNNGTVRRVFSVAPFAAMTRDRAKRLVTTKRENVTNRKFYAGDHWQDSEGWVGPIPEPDESAYSLIYDELERGFVSSNKIKEVVERHRDGVVGHEPTWHFTPRAALKIEEKPNAGTQSRIDECEALLTAWWDKRDIPNLLKKMAVSLLLEERAVLRFFVPRGFLNAYDENGVRRTEFTALSIEDALDQIYIDVCPYDQSIVYVDHATMQAVGVYAYTQQKDPLRDGQSGDEVELTYLDATGRTVLRVIDKNDVRNDAFFDIGQRLTMYQVDRETFITEQVRENQRALNLALTVMTRNIITGGFLERILFNAQSPGKVERVENQDGTVTKKFTPEEFVTGPNTTAFVRGIVVENADGSKSITNPSVAWREPIPVDSSDRATQANYQIILDEVHQSHIAITRDATPSGFSREQARAHFERSLEPTATVTMSATRWLLETALAMSEFLAGQRGVYTDELRAVVTVNKDVGPLSSDERRADTEAVDKGLMSRESAMERAGLLDPDAEIARINADAETNPGMLEKKATVLQAFVTAIKGADEEMIRSLAQIVGLTDKQTNALVKAAAAAKKAAEQQAKDQFERDKEMKAAGGPKANVPPRPGSAAA